jgi:hypothetical protein
VAAQFDVAARLLGELADRTAPDPALRALVRELEAAWAALAEELRCQGPQAIEGQQRQQEA